MHGKGNSKRIGRWFAWIAVAAAFCWTGCSVTTNKGSTVAIEGVTAVTPSPTEPGVVYVAKDGKIQRCMMIEGGLAFSNCQYVNLD